MCWWGLWWRAEQPSVSAGFRNGVGVDTTRFSHAQVVGHTRGKSGPGRSGSVGVATVARSFVAQPGQTG